MTEDSPVYLVDGSAYIFRAYYATPRLTNAQGFPTNALFGFTKMMMKFLRDAAPEHVLMVFDAGRETFRNEIYPEYKANRDECPEDLQQQMPYFRDISRALGMHVVELPGYEADDVIGTVAEAFLSTEHPVVIVSADKDLMQLVNGHISMWDTMRDLRYGPKQVEEKLGIPPEQVIDYLAIAGDSSDNIPGLKGAGPKTAIQLIKGYGTVEEVLAAKDSILEDKSIRSRKKIAAQIECDEELVRLSKRLVTILRDAPVGTLPLGNTEELLSMIALQDPIHDELAHLVEQFQFESLVRDYGVSGVTPKESPTREEHYTLILKDDFSTWKETFLAQEIFAFDLETTSLKVHEAEIVGIALSWSEEEAYYIPFTHKERADEQLSLEEFLAAVGDHFTDRKIKKVGQNLKYDCQVFFNVGLKVNGVAFDTMIAEYLLHPDRGGYGLSALSKSHLRHTMLEYDEIVPADGDFRDVPLQDALRYAAEDAHVTWLVYQKLAPAIEDAGLTRIAEEIEFPLVEVLADVEYRGVNLDVSFLEKMSEELGAELAELEKKIYAEAGEEFNINSPKQLGVILFENLEIPTTGIKKTKTGFSTNHAVLEQLAEDYPIAEFLLDYRMLAKLKSTYVDALPTEVSPVSGRLHTRLNQTIAATGRLSSSQPNLQNIPIQTERGREVRRAFSAPEGKLLLSADYSQIELRLLAHLSEDQTLIRSFVDGEDIHEKTAREVLDIGPLMEVTADDRRLGKTINFGIVYGMSGFRLARDLGIPVKEGTRYIEQYFARYPGVQQYFDSLESEIEAGGEVRTLYDRRRLVSEIDAQGRDRGFVKRAAMNAPLQGSAADLIKLAMIRLEKRITDEKLPLEMVLQVHDELLFEVPADQGEEMIQVVREAMEQVIDLSVPLEVQVSLGKNWEEAH